MERLLSAIREADDFTALGAASDEQVSQAQDKLQLVFAADYTAYLKAFGAAFVGDKELTGICKSDRLNVVGVTERARAYYPNFPSDAYVVEEMLIDHIIAIQKKDGSVYNYGPADQETKIADSLYEYLFEIDG